MHEIKNKYYTATACLVTGQLYVFRNNYAEALNNYYLALKSFEEIKAKAGVAECFDGIGDLYSIEGNDSEPIVAFSQSLKVYEELKEKSFIAWTELMKTVKAKSSKFINDHSLTSSRFKWQDGYGVFT